MKNLCPLCSAEIFVWYSLKDQEVKVCCPNGQCELFKHDVTGCGDSSREAIEHLAGLALKYEPKNTSLARGQKTMGLPGLGAPQVCLHTNYPYDT